MKRDELRFECLKLTYCHGRDAAEAVIRAKVLEEYILQASSESSSESSGLPKKESTSNRKNVGNASASTRVS